MNLNKYLWIILLIFLSFLPGYLFGRTDVSGLFEKGNLQYAHGDYKEAIKNYQQVIDAGYESVALYFNTGNANYKLGDFASAILYYEKAHKLAPADDDVNFNLRFANLKTSDKIEETPEFFLTNWWKKVILGLSVSTLSFLTTLLMLSASMLFIFYLFAKTVSRKKLTFFSSITLCFLALFSFFISARQMSYFNDQKQAIIFSASVSVKNAPAESSGTLLILHEGTKVNILGTSDGWEKIRLANGNQGWIKMADLRVI